MNPKLRQRPQPRILNIGANRGARANLGALTSFARRTDAAPPTVVYVDPAPGRASETAALARRQDVDASGVEARAEDVIASMDATALMANVDDPATLATVIEVARAQQLPLLGLLILQLPDGRLSALMHSLRAGDPQAERLIRFHRALVGVTARGGSRAIFGAGTPPTNGLLEPSIRAAFREHSAAELARVIANVPAEREPAEIAIAGRAPVPFLVTEGSEFGEPREVVGRLIDDGGFTLRRGRSIVAAEVTPAGIRLHEARLRVIDGELAVRPVSTITAEAMERLRAPVVPPPTLATASAGSGLGFAMLGLGLLAAAAAGIESVGSDTMTRTRPVHTTD